MYLYLLLPDTALGLCSQVESTAQVVPRPLTWVQQTSHTAAAAAQPDQHQQQQPGQQPEQQLQQQQQQRLPWEGCPRSDPRAAVNSSGHTPADVAARTQQSDELLMLLDPGLPVTGVLQDSGLMAAPIKLPTLAVSVAVQHCRWVDHCNVVGGFYACCWCWFPVEVSV